MNERFDVFLDKLKSPANAILIVLGVVLLVDYHLGCPLARQIVLLQMRLFKINPDAQNFRLLTVFGEFSSIDPLVRQIDLWCGGILTVVPLVSYLSGLFQWLTIKKIK